MHAGVLPQMAQNTFSSANGLGMPSGLASRRGGQNIKPLSFDGLSKSSGDKDNTVPTPRTSRSHLLAGLRTAPKSATSANFPASPTTSQAPGLSLRNGSVSNNAYTNAPKTSMPRFNQQQQQQQPAQTQQQLYQQQALQQLQLQQQQQQQQQQALAMQYTAEQLLMPQEFQLNDQDQMDPGVYAQLLATNYTLAQQHQRLTQQLAALHAAAQQFQGYGFHNPQQQAAFQQQMLSLYQQQQQLQQQQQALREVQAFQASLAAQQPQSVYVQVDPVTGQLSYIDASPAQASDYNSEQAQLSQAFVQLQLQQQQQQLVQLQQEQAQQQQQQQQQQISNTPRVQVSPPPAENATPTGVRNKSPPRRYESPVEPTPLPPPSANAFRRGHKKSSSLANVNSNLRVGGQDAPPSAGPKTASFPLTPSHGPGQGRAGEHPSREPRGPPQLDELRAAPTSKHNGSKNFVHQARRFAVTNLVRAGMERRKGTTSSTGSMSPVSESAEELETPLTDNDSESGRSGSGSLAGDIECNSSGRGSWGAIGADRPSSRSKARNSLESSGSATSPCDSDASFAGVFKKSQQSETLDTQRKAPRLVLTSAEKRKTTGTMMA